MLLALRVIVEEKEDAAALEVRRQLWPPLTLAPMIAGGGETTKRAEIVDIPLAASDQDGSIAALYQLGQPVRDRPLWAFPDPAAIAV